MGVIQKMKRAIEDWNEEGRQPAKRSRGSSQPNAKALFANLGSFTRNEDEDGSEYLGSGAAKQAGEKLSGRAKQLRRQEEEAMGSSRRTHPSGGKSRY